MLRQRILRKRILIPIGTLVVTAALAIALPMTSASAATCNAPVWNAPTAYVGGTQVTFNGR